MNLLVDAFYNPCELCMCGCACMNFFNSSNPKGSFVIVGGYQGKAKSLLDWVSSLYQDWKVDIGRKNIMEVMSKKQ